MIDKNLFENADKFLAAKPTQGDMLFYVWGHGYEFDFGTKGSSWDRLKSFCDTFIVFGISRSHISTVFAHCVAM